MKALNQLEGISFHSDYPNFSLDFKDKLQQWLLSIANRAYRDISLLEYIFCTDEDLLEINKKHLKHDYYTDIITFPLEENPIEATIFISIDRVRENAKDFKVSFENELYRVLVHGLLHLLGHSDKDEEEKAQMRQLENDCLKLLKV